MPPPNTTGKQTGGGKPGGKKSGGSSTTKSSSGASPPKSGTKSGAAGTRAKGGAAAGTKQPKIDTKKALEEGFHKGAYLRARAEAWRAQAKAHDKAARSKMGLAAKLGQSINKLMEEKGVAQAPELFKMWDSDGNGLIDRSEWKSACKSMKLEGATDEGIDALYNELDGDGSGEIDLSELAEGLRLLRDKVAKAMNDLATVVTDVDGLQACAHVAVRAAEAADAFEAAEAALAALAGDAPNRRELEMKMDDAKKFATSKLEELREMEEETREELEATRQARAAKAAREAKAEAADKVQKAAEAEKPRAPPAEPKVDLW